MLVTLLAAFIRGTKLCGFLWSAGRAILDMVEPDTVSRGYWLTGC